MCGQIRPVLIAGPHHERLLFKWLNQQFGDFFIVT